MPDLQHPADATQTSPERPFERQWLERLQHNQEAENRRRWRWRWTGRVLKIAFVLALLAVNASLLRHCANLQKFEEEGPHTALVRIEGLLVDGEGSLTAQSVIDALDDAFSDTQSRGVILAINSPGGSPVFAGQVHDAILQFKHEHKKPVMAVIGDTGASAAYYIAVAADKIFVDRASIVGSIGVVSEGFGFTDLMRRWGVERRVYVSGANKAFLDPFLPQDAAQKAHIQTLLDDIHEQFKAAVKAGRGARLKVTRDTFSGLFWTGERAIALGLADAYGTANSVAEKEIGAKDLVDYTQEENPIERLMRRTGVQAARSLLSAAALPALR